MSLPERPPEKSQERLSQPTSADLAATEKKIQEIETWLEKLEANIPQNQNQNQNQTRDNNDDNDQSDDQTQSTTLTKPIILPLTKTEIETGLHQPIWSSAHWLAEWAIRMIKMYHNRVMYPAVV